MEIYELTNKHTEEDIHKTADLLMGQMASIGGPNAYDKLITVIRASMEESAHAHMFVASHEGKVLGAAFLNVQQSLDKGGKFIWLNDLYVDVNHRNRGIAKKLLLHVIHWAEQHDMKGIELETGVNNQATKALYNSLGFYDVVSKRYGFQF
ncbi:ribosomal protein S18 acetylase RimI-like enzyme [Geomicrobium halophilum]|uniref:Ribosomal protein S18 acetylase RimI-like enzyme n=1 Tax=Geomicrobium halophilum TaxID=549000 RepID=A0A841PI32_9BACL|nr:GNAT family N-acetyltransferase [Geomicrobium halophilum]MBB6448450.1 ribosomal protein S18 acetylase RimI-like enzyme [Geomicrobium halophilum]